VVRADEKLAAFVELESETPGRAKRAISYASWRFWMLSPTLLRELQSSAPQCFGAWDPFSFKKSLAFADQTQRQMRERSEIAAGADRACLLATAASGTREICSPFSSIPAA
jgi:hypothetical protein